MTEQAPDADERPTVDELTESLTGFDEVAIAKAFGKDMEQLTGTLPARALVFILERREGLNDAGAFTASMSASMRAIEDRFADEEIVLGDEEPVTPQGEGEPGGE